MSKHTPGPWRVDDEIAGRFNVKLPSGLTVAWSWADIPPLQESGEANAHLIAAAPEMYEALKMIFDAIDGDYLPLAVEKSLVAAIAKAEGRQ